MASRTTKTRISETDKRYFREIFDLNANSDKKIDQKGLDEIFKMVGFTPNDKQKAEFDELFAKKPMLSFPEFMTIFSLKSNSQFNETDVLNSFRLLSKEYDREGMIKIDRVKEILLEMGINDLEVTQLTTQLQSLQDSDGYFNFEEFVKSAF